MKSRPSLPPSKPSLPGRRDLRLAVVSPFLDRQHGTERCIVEQIGRFLQRQDCEIHIYSQSVRDLEVVPFSSRSSDPSFPRRAIWHRVPALPAPHLFNFLWWYFANQALRWFHRIFRALSYDVIFSPGINCSDADAIVTHAVFHRLYRDLQYELRLRYAPLSSWPVLLHRRLYYRLLMALEKRIYADKNTRLAAVSNLTASELSAFFSRTDVAVIPNAVDTSSFNPAERLRRRAKARSELQISESSFVVLLIGNDWKNKGLSSLLRAVAALPQFPLQVLVAGRDNRDLFLSQIESLQLPQPVLFADPSPDVMRFYAAADAYCGPSLHESFSLPPLEAMACGLPVIASSRSGVSQAITNGSDGLILENPEDPAGLAELLSRLCQQPGLCRSLGENAARTAQSYSWERNAADTWEFLCKTASMRSDLPSGGVAHD
jgi:glycosyltransferase involved in cell wall biosynthesis